MYTLRAAKSVVAYATPNRLWNIWLLSNKFALKIYPINPSTLTVLDYARVAVDNVVELSDEE